MPLMDLKDQFDALDPDTRRNVNDILRDGYYKPSAALGEGGWKYLSHATNDWRGWSRYKLFIHGEPERILIYARSAWTAVKYFQTNYRLKGVQYSIDEEIIESREIYDSTTNELVTWEENYAPLEATSIPFTDEPPQ